MAIQHNPEVVITHESDLDGFVSDHLLQRLANHLFGGLKLQAWNYTNFEKRPLRESCAWVCDLNFCKRDNWLIVDHHRTDHDPQYAQLILDHDKSASLLCYELCKEYGLGNEKLDRFGATSPMWAICTSLMIRISPRPSITAASSSSTCF